jgi:histone H3/H4
MKNKIDEKIRRYQVIDKLLISKASFYRLVQEIFADVDV